jgi:hypothetical protein
VRLFALLLVHQHLSAEDTVLDEWIQQVLASPGSSDVGRRLANATKQRGIRCLKVVGSALAGLPGVGQIAREPVPNDLMHYLIRLVVGGSKKAADRRPLLGPTYPCGRGNSSRIAHAARRVAELLNGPDREILADALVEQALTFEGRGQSTA